MIAQGQFRRRTLRLDFRNDDGYFTASIINESDGAAIPAVISCSDAVANSTEMKRLVLLMVSLVLDEVLARESP